MTRDCLDPWVYIQFRSNGEVRPCCVRPPIGNLDAKPIAQILNDEPIRRVRESLLTGRPDDFCRGCGIRSVTTPELLIKRVEALLQDVRLPDEFDPELYLDANPLLRKAGVEPESHFLRHGRFEGRPLIPDHLR